AFMSAGAYLLTLLTVDSTQLEVARDVVLFGVGLGLSFSVFNVVAQNAVRAEYISSSTSAIQFVRQIGGTLGLAVLGSIVNQQLKEKIPQDVPASALARVPPQLRSQITDPQVLFSDQIQKAINGISDPQAKAALIQTIDQIQHGVRLALADSLHVAFEVSMVALVISLVLTLFLREIPLKKTSAMQDRAALRAEAAAAGEAVG
ncbi:MAG: hypothetical protein M3O87_07840, partial [Candidatus Dormibacteraeota bacterium]|nr:hypothetical protein [Candidatus Dormibacteraeota bacterium]